MAKHHNHDGSICHWSYCTRCGHVHMKNAASRKESKKPCQGSDEDR